MTGSTLERRGNVPEEAPEMSVEDHAFRPNSIDNIIREDPGGKRGEPLQLSGTRDLNVCPRLRNRPTEKH